MELFGDWSPIASRQDQSASSGAASHSIYTIINKIDRLDSGIKAIKNDILNQMESKLNELKTTVVCMIENLGTNRTYADVSKSYKLYTSKCRRTAFHGK